MLQFIVSFLPIMAIITATCRLAFKMKRSGRCMEQMLYDFSWFIDKAPAQVAFFMFSIAAAIASTLIVCAFSHVSRQLILALDIIFFFSSILLILLHQLKEHTPASLQTIPNV